MIQQTHLRSFRCLFSASSSCLLFTLYFVVFICILFIAAGTARHTPQQLRIALGLNLLYIIVYIVRVSRSQAARTANWNWLDEIRFQFHEFATRLKLSLLRLDTFIWFAWDSQSPRLSVCLSISRRRCCRRCRCRRPSLSDGCLNAASASSSFVFGEVCKQCLALVRLVRIGISWRSQCLLQFVAKLTHGN